MLKIGIDCAPFSPRPDTYIKEIATLIDADVNQPISAIFGTWIWKLNVSQAKYTEKSSEIQNYFEYLYSKGLIRGAFYEYVK